MAKVNEVITFSALTEQYCSDVPKQNNVFLEYHFPARKFSPVLLQWTGEFSPSFGFYK
jgi:hypothetical protein